MNKILFVILVIALLLCGFSKAQASEIDLLRVLSAQENSNQLGVYYSEMVDRLSKTDSPKAFEIFLAQAIQTNWSEQDLRVLKAVLAKWQSEHPAKKSEVRFQLQKDLAENIESSLNESELTQAFPDTNEFSGFRILKNYRPLAAVDVKERQSESAKFVIYSDKHQPVGYWGKIDELPMQAKKLSASADWKFDLKPEANNAAPSFSNPMPDESKQNWVRPVSVVVGIGLAVLAASYLQNKKLVIRR